MTLNQANQVNATANTFEYFETNVNVFASNNEGFELAA